MENYLFKLSLIFSSLLISFGVQSQTTTVGLQHYETEAFEGYTLFTPEKNNSVYLINNCGEKINEWTFTEKPGATCYLLEDGNLLRAGKQSIEIRDWENNVVWSFLMSKLNVNQHHDIEPLPNGNVLCLVKDIYTKTEIIAMGRDSSKADSIFKLDKLIEIQPIESDSAIVVWEWKFSDHFIQDFDATKPNYGTVIDHPELIDLNFDNSFTGDYTHVNGIDYNAELDQIIMSPRHLHELYIIDHSTTTEEAASNSGGNSGMGGDILWRWGNPQVYRQGTSEDQKLFKPHDPKWVEPGYLDEGKITVFNNGNDREPDNSYSSIHLINPEIINDLYTLTDNKFNPIDYEWSWDGTIFGETVYQDKKSGTHCLPNGNFIMCENSLGRVSELNREGELLWSYTNPSGLQIFNQLESPSSNGLFRAEKYPSNYIGFVGLDLTPQGIIEDVNSISDICNETISVSELKIEDLKMINPVENGLIEFNQDLISKSISISDLNGRVLFIKENFNGNNLKISLDQGIYIITIQAENDIINRKFIYR